MRARVYDECAPCMINVTVAPAAHRSITPGCTTVRAPMTAANSDRQADRRHAKNDDRAQSIKQ